MASGNRVAVVNAVRTPFVKAGTAFSQLTLQDLGVHVLQSLIERSELDPRNLDEFVFSTVLLDPRTPNWAREILFAAGLPKDIYAYSVSNNCISGLVAIAAAAERIALGHTDCAIAGGSESMSNPALLFSKQASDIFLKLFRARSMGDKLKLLASFRPKHFAPQPPAPTEPSTGLTMGEHMEITAKRMNIGREEQDALALASHQNASKASEEGLLQELIAPLAGVERDTMIRADTSLEKLAKLRPVFDRSGKGTLTAGNSSPLTDGASAVLLMSERRAEKEGREPLAFISSYEWSAIDPEDGLLMAPGVAVPRLLKRKQLHFDSFDRIEVHEAFAAQVLANVQAWEEGWKEESVGKLDRDCLNVQGGSISIGHPFAATGGRIVGMLAHEMKRLFLKRGLISICAAGAMAGAMILERD